MLRRLAAALAATRSELIDLKSLPATNRYVLPSVNWSQLRLGRGASVEVSFRMVVVPPCVAINVSAGIKETNSTF